MHGTKVAQLAFRSMHFAIELAELYISYNGIILTWYTSLIGWVLHGLLLKEQLTQVYTVAIPVRTLTRAY